MKFFLLVLHHFCKNKALEVRPANPARVQAVGASFANRSGKRWSVQPFGEVQRTGRGCPGSRLWKRCMGDSPWAASKDKNWGHLAVGSVVGPKTWEDWDKPCKGKGLLVSEGGCVQGASGCPGVGIPRGARVGEMLAGLMPISCSTTDLP